MRVVFLGTGDIGVPSLKALATGGRHEVQAVFTQPDRPAGRGLKLQAPPVKVAAQELGLPIYQPEKIRSPVALTDLTRLEPDLIVVAAFGQILPKAILSLPRFGCVNIHASLLPRHRGASPIQASILEGDRETGITIMQMDEGLDMGDILLKVATPIGPGETAGELHNRLAALAPNPLLKCLDLLESGAVAREKQNDSLATHAPRLTHKDGEIVWDASAEEIERRVRAMAPWPGAYTYLPLGAAPVVLKVHRAEVWEGSGGPPGTVEAADDRGIRVAAGTGGVSLTEIQVAGGKRLTAADFLRGHPIASGVRLGRTD